MALLVSHPHDCSIPYKKFQDLKDGDFIFMVDYKNLSINKYEIKDVQVEKVFSVINNILYNRDINIFFTNDERNNIEETVKDVISSIHSYTCNEMIDPD